MTGNEQMSSKALSRALHAQLMHAGQACPMPVSPVEAALVELNNAASLIESAVHGLAARMQPVLRQEPPGEEHAGQGFASTCYVDERINESTRQILGICRIVESLHGRLAI